VGAMWRDVQPDYSNIATMSGVMMEYVGRMAHLPDIYETGHRKVMDVYKLYKKYNSLCEFNSPTYMGTSLFGVALWRQLSPSHETRRRGAKLEDSLWNDLAVFYNPNLLNLCGPYFRSYNMDMLRCYTCGGMWITLAVNNEKFEPMPGHDGSKSFEINSFALFELVCKKIQPEIVEKFKTIDEPRFISRDVYNTYTGEKIKKVNAYIAKDWMMGGCTGHRWQFTQLVPGTIHWKKPKSKYVNWILVPSYNKADVVVDESEMKIFVGGNDTSNLTLLAYVPFSRSEQFHGNRWKLQGMELLITTDLAEPVITTDISTEEVYKYTSLPATKNNEQIYDIIKIEFPLSESTQSDGPLLTIKPIVK
jgi:hypothetical protein